MILYLRWRSIPNVFMGRLRKGKGCFTSFWFVHHKIYLIATGRAVYDQSDKSWTIFTSLPAQSGCSRYWECNLPSTTDQWKGKKTQNQKQIIEIHLSRIRSFYALWKSCSFNFILLREELKRLETWLCSKDICCITFPPVFDDEFCMQSAQWGVLYQSTRSIRAVLFSCGTRLFSESVRLSLFHPGKKVLRGLFWI